MYGCQHKVTRHKKHGPTKEQIKYSETDPNEVEVCELPDKEFKIYQEDTQWAQEKWYMRWWKWECENVNKENT